VKSHFHQAKNGLKLHYQTVDNILPETTVFLHGNVASNRWWIPAQDVFYKESKGRNYAGKMICIEFFGCGKSDAPRTPDDLNMVALATEFNSLIAKNFPDQKVNVVGHSTGGFIAAAMTALNPELFKKAVLLDPVGAKGLVLDDNIKAGFRAMAADKNITAMALGATIHGNDPESDFFKKVIVEDGFSAVQKIGYWVVEAFHNLDATALMKNSTTSTLVLHGEYDNLLSKDASEELAVKYLKNAKFEVVPGHGHCMNVENPKDFVSKISGFLFS
jgi:pimeloyl-ACP methyl ester carboxylesterase